MQQPKFFRTLGSLLLTSSLVASLGVASINAYAEDKPELKEEKAVAFSLPFMPLNLRLSDKSLGYLNQVKFIDVNPKAKGFNARGYQAPSVTTTPYSVIFKSDGRLENFHKMMVVYYQGLYDYFYQNRNEKDHKKFLLGALDKLVPYDLSENGKVYRDGIATAFSSVIPVRNSGIDQAQAYLLKDFALLTYTSQMMSYCFVDRNTPTVPTFCNGAAIASIILMDGFKKGQAYIRRLGFLSQIPQEMDLVTDEQKLDGFKAIMYAIEDNQESFRRLVGFQMPLGGVVLPPKTPYDLTLRGEKVFAEDPKVTAEKKAKAEAKAKEEAEKAKSEAKPKTDVKDASPADAKSADGKPADTKPSEAAPSDAKPTDKSADVKPTDAKPTTK